MQLFSKHSPFLGVPKGLNARERLTLDAIRYSGQMTALTFERLRAAASEYSKRNIDQIEQPDELRIAILADAWSTVDMLNRLRVLIRTYPAPGFDELPLVRTFIKRSEPIETVRNRFQHLSEQLTGRKELVPAAAVVLGQVSWLFVPDPGDMTKPMFLFGVSGGTAPQDNNLQHAIKASKVGGNTVELPTGRFELHAFGKVARLSEQIANLRACILAMEEFLRASFDGRARRIAENHNIPASLLLEPMLECSAFRIEIRFGGSSTVSADQDLEAISSMRSPGITF